jgi:hypothetical protein
MPPGPYTAREEQGKIVETLYQIDFQSLESDFNPLVRSEHVVLLAHIHCIPSVVYLFEFLIRNHGLQPNQMAILPKRYSTISSAVCSLRKLGITIIENAKQIKPGHYDESAFNALSALCEHGESCIRRVEKYGTRSRLVLVDDGGLLAQRWARRYELGEAALDVDVVSVQQTASGVYREPRLSTMPKINVAYSAAKRRFESTVIAGGVVRKIDSLNICTGRKTVGIVGLGSIGKAVASKLRQRAGTIVVYDKAHVTTDFEIAKKQSDLFRKVDFIFGCTGRNWVKLSAFDKADKEIRYISCSSRDIEFKQLIQNRFARVIDNKEFGVIELNGRKPQLVENGGFPINFDREKEWEWPSEIGLTRALMLAGILQAMCVHLPSNDWNIQLSTAAQQHLVQSWLALCGKQPEDFGVAPADLSSLSWWSSESLGSSML